MSDPPPRPARTGVHIDLLVGLVAGSAYVIAVETVGHESGLLYWLGSGLVGLLLGALLSEGGMLPAMAGFYGSGMLLLGVLGHLNLLPCAMAFFVVPTLLFGIAAQSIWALVRQPSQHH